MICRAGWLRVAMGYPGVPAISLAIAVPRAAGHRAVVAPRHHDCADLVAGALVHHHRLDLEATAAGLLRGRLVIVQDMQLGSGAWAAWPRTSKMS